MIKEDREALVCDMAETYHIFSIESLPARRVATLACGLKADSRIKTKMAGVKASPPNLLLLALIVDELRAIRYGLTGDKKNKPVFVMDVMTKGIPDKETKGFDSGAEFEAFRASILAKVK